MKKQMKDTQNEIKQNIQGTNSDRKETRTQSNDLEQKEEINIQPKPNEETRIQKKWRGARESLGQPEAFQYWNYRAARRRRTKARNWKLIWTNNKGKLPQSGKGNRVPGSPGSPEIPTKLDPKRNTQRYIIKLPKIKYKETILKAAREKDRVTYKGVPIRLSADFLKETLQVRRGWKEVFKVVKGKLNNFSTTGHIG